VVGASRRFMIWNERLDEGEAPSPTWTAAISSTASEPGAAAPRAWRPTRRIDLAKWVADADACGCPRFGTGGRTLQAVYRSERRESADPSTSKFGHNGCYQG